LNALSERLWNEGITSVIIEGGGKVIGSFLQAGLYDRVSLFYTPYIFGDGVKLADFNGCEKLAEAVKLGKMEVKRVENDAFITFKPL
jgi:diaminohydroxyphosphoribosylaminopyrimidine deaminase/5-amino-6-(5-phosphoribosylamino)uracil reductase